MKKTKEELIEALKAHEEALGDSFLTMIEDIADSVEAPKEPDMSGYVKKEDYDALKQKYIDRFTSKSDDAPRVEQKKEDEKKKETEVVTIDDFINQL